MVEGLYVLTVPRLGTHDHGFEYRFLKNLSLDFCTLVDYHIYRERERQRSMKSRTLLLFVFLLLLVLATAAWFHLQHEGGLHRAGVLHSISKSGVFAFFCMADWLVLGT